jgi:putative transposase
MKQRRHTTTEIAAKLQQADAMSTEGKLYGDIAKALGISVMTYHRWRKARVPSRLALSARPVQGTLTASSGAGTERIGELLAENAQLRRLVTDLLLEKMSLGDGIYSGADDMKSTARR